MTNDDDSGTFAETDRQPTPAEIQNACRKIQEGWSPSVRRRRDATRRMKKQANPIMTFRLGVLFGRTPRQERLSESSWEQRW